MITTEKIRLSPKKFFHILLIIYLKKWWWLFVIMWVGAIIFLSFDERDSFENFAVIFSVIYPIIYIIYVWRYSNSKENKLFFLERYYDIYEDKIIGILSDGTEDVIKLEYLIKVITLKKNYLLYIAKNHFIIIPKDSFKNQLDIEWVEQNIITKIKNKK